MKSNLDVVAAILIDGQKVLIAQRSEEKFEQRWEFPGGKVEPGELPEKALAREMLEELNLSCQNFQYFADSYLALGSRQLRLQAFTCRSFSGEIKVRVHADARWVEIRYLHLYRFLEADIPIVEKLQNELSSIK